MDDGLPNQTVSAIARSEDGYLWVGTDAGLARFDGHRFRVYDVGDGLPGGRIVELLAAQRGGVYVATQPGGLFLFDGESFVSILPDIFIWSLLEDGDGALWIATPHGLFLWRGTDTSRVDLDGAEPAPIVFALLHDPNGDLVVGHKLGLSRLHDDGTWSTDGAELIAPPISSLTRDAHGNVWAGAGNGIWRLTDGVWGRVPGAQVSYPQLLSDSAGNVWSWAMGGALHRFDGQAFSEVDDLADDTRSLLIAVSDGPRSIWLGSTGRGLHRLHRPIFGSLTEADGLLASQVGGVIASSDGAVWLGTYKQGLTRWDADGVRSYGISDGLPDDLVLAIAEDVAEKIWVGTALGLAVGDGDGFSQIPIPPEEGNQGTFVSSILPESDGSVLVALRPRLLRYRNGVAEQLLPSGRLRSPGIRAMYRDRRGRLWLGGRDLCRYMEPKLTCFDDLNLPGSPITDFLETPSNELWAATEGHGLCRIEEGDSLSCLSTDRGLPSGSILRVLLDDLGWAWLSSHRGLSRLRLRELEAAFDDEGLLLRADTFSREDGLPSTAFIGTATPAGARLSDGRLALPTAEGLALIDPRIVSEASATIPRTHIEGLVVDGGPVPLGGDITLLEPGTDRLTFQYTGIHPPAPEKVRFRYPPRGARQRLAVGGSRTDRVVHRPAARLLSLRCPSRGRWQRLERRSDPCNPARAAFLRISMVPSRARSLLAQPPDSLVPCTGTPSAGARTAQDPHRHRSPRRARQRVVRYLSRVSGSRGGSGHEHRSPRSAQRDPIQRRASSTASARSRVAHTTCRRGLVARTTYADHRACIARRSRAQLHHQRRRPQCTARDVGPERPSAPVSRTAYEHRTTRRRDDCVGTFRGRRTKAHVGGARRRARLRHHSHQLRHRVRGNPPSGRRARRPTRSGEFTRRGDPSSTLPGNDPIARWRHRRRYVNVRQC